jgi:AraC family transcriptional regulator
VDSDISVTTFPAMKLAEIEIVGPVELEMRALDWLYMTWLPRSHHVPDHQPIFEAGDGEPFAHGNAHFELRLQLPVVDAAVPL